MSLPSLVIQLINSFARSSCAIADAPPQPLTNTWSTTIDSIHAAADRRFLDSKEAAEYLGGGLNSRTVTRWAREGYLPAYPIGDGLRRLWRFLEADLDQWMFSRRTGHTLISATDVPTGGYSQ